MFAKNQQNIKHTVIICGKKKKSFPHELTTCPVALTVTTVSAVIGEFLSFLYVSPIKPKVLWSHLWFPRCNMTIFPKASNVVPHISPMLALLNWNWAPDNDLAGVLLKDHRYAVKVFSPIQKNCPDPNWWLYFFIEKEYIKLGSKN